MAHLIRNGVPAFDIRLVKRCGAKTRRNTACGSPAMRNGRCRIHGGLCTGARTEEGKRRLVTNYKHGRLTQEAGALKRAKTANRRATGAAIRAVVAVFRAADRLDKARNPSEALIDRTVRAGESFRIAKRRSKRSKAQLEAAREANERRLLESTQS